MHTENARFLQVLRLWQQQLSPKQPTNFGGSNPPVGHHLVAARRVYANAVESGDELRISAAREQLAMIEGAAGVQVPSGAASKWCTVVDASMAWVL